MNRKKVQPQKVDDKNLQNQFSKFKEYVEKSPTARRLHIHQPAFLLMMAWPMLWGFFSSPMPQVSHLLQAVLLISVLQVASTLYNDTNSEDEESINSTEEEGMPSMILLIILALFGSWIAFSLGAGTLFTVLVWAILVAGFPFLAKFTWWPQVCYGFVYGAWPVLIGQAASGDMTFNIIPVMFASFFWATALETLRADTELDEGDKLHFIREILGKEKFSFVTICLIAALGSLVFSGLLLNFSGLFYGLLMIAQALLTYAYQSQGKDEEVSYRTYQISALSGLLISIGFLLG